MGQILELLINNGAKIDITSQYLQTPLHFAVITGKIENVNILLDSDDNLDLNIRDYKGQTVLHHAVILSLIEIIKLLITKGPRKNLLDLDNKKPIDYTENEMI